MNPNVSAEAIRLVLNERSSQDRRWGDQAHHPDTTWLAILIEEVGQLAQVVLHSKFGGHHGTWDRAIEEATQVAAVAMAHLEALIVRRDRGDEF